MYAPALKEMLLMLSNKRPLVTEDRGLKRAIFSVIISESVERFALNIFVTDIISSNFAFVILKHFAPSLKTVIVALLGSSLMSANSPK